MEFIAALLAALPSVISGLILGKVHGWQKRSDENTKLRQKEGYLMMKSLDANGNLARQTAKCLQSVVPNAQLTKALDYQTQVQHELEDHLMDVSSKLNN